MDEKNNLPDGWNNSNEDINEPENSPWDDNSKDDDAIPSTLPSFTKPKTNILLIVMGIAVALAVAFIGGMVVISMLGYGANSKKTNETNSDPVSTVKTEDESWKTAYLKIVHEWEKKGREIESTRKYWLLYIDDNDVPELYMAWYYYGDEHYMLYTYHDEKAILISESEHHRENNFREYVEKSNFTMHYSRDGEQVYDLYELKNGKYTLIESFQGYEEWQKQLDGKWSKMQEIGEGYSYKEMVSMFGGEVKTRPNTESPTLIMPSLANMDANVAKRELEDMGFKVKIIEIGQSEIQKGIVVTTDPLSGYKVNENQEVLLYVSTGPALREITVPNIKGYFKDYANSVLLEYGLSRGNVIIADSTAPKDTVISQTPAEGQKVPEGTPVNYVISSGNAPTIVNTVEIKVPLPGDVGRSVILTAWMNGYKVYESYIDLQTDISHNFEVKIYGIKATVAIYLDAVDYTWFDIDCSKNDVNERVKMASILDYSVLVTS